MHLEYNRTRDNVEIATRNLKKILNAHRTKFVEYHQPSASEIRQKYPELTLQEVLAKRNEIDKENGVEGLVRLDHDIWISTIDAERKAPQGVYGHNYGRDIVHAAYCGCSGCEGRMGYW